MDLIKRSTFLKRVGYIATSGVISPFLYKLYGNELTAKETKGILPASEVFISKNGTPDINMQKVIDMAGGIESFIDIDDVVIIKPSLQWANQGYTHTLAAKTLIEIILNRSGGFTGEILVAEDTHSDDGFNDQSKGWNSSPENRLNNWPDLNYREMVEYFHDEGKDNVSAAPISGTIVSGPEDGEGYVASTFTTQNNPSSNGNGRIVRLGYPIIQSPYSGNLIDSKNGVWNDGYTGEKVKIIFLPTLNYHSEHSGITSAIKSHFGFIPLGGGSDVYDSLHADRVSGTGIIENSTLSLGDAAFTAGESIGELISSLINPALYITVAEYSGQNGRVKRTAEHTKTIGLCKDPVSLDYWMGKNVICPIEGLASNYNPSEDNVFRQWISGCNSKGIGTLNEAEMFVQVYDHDNPQINRIEIEKKIKLFKEGNATEAEVLELIEKYIKEN